MWIKRPLRNVLTGGDIAPGDITPRAVFENRRRVLQAAGLAAAGGLLGGSGAALAAYASPDARAAKLAAKTNPKFVAADKVTPFRTSPPTTTSTNSAPTRATPRRTPARCGRARGG